MTYKILLATFGSLGDLHPFIAVGLALRAQGCRVTVASAEEYRDKVTAAGLGFAAVRPSFAALESRLGMSRAQLTEAITARNDFLFVRVVCPWLRESHADLDGLVADADLVLTSGLAFGACLAAEARQVPWIGIVLQPMLFLSAHDPPVLPKAEWLTHVMRRLGPGPARPLLRAVKTAIGMVFGPYRKLRGELGLHPLRVDPLFDAQFMSLGAVGLYSPLLGARQPDHPPRTDIVGFAHFDSGDGRVAALDADLARFLAAGTAPLVFTLGSTMVNNPGDFYRASAAAARALRRRAVLLVGEDGMTGCRSLAGEDVFVTAYAAHSLLFERAAAVIHHGGIGTLAQGLRAGRPQLVVPFFADQPDNAARLRRLGVARELRPRLYTAPRAAAELAALLQDPAYAAAALEAREHLRAEDGAVNAAGVILARLREWRGD